jgi:hypothetical protein
MGLLPDCLRHILDLMRREDKPQPVRDRRQDFGDGTSFPAIRNSTGMALKIQLNAFIEKALDHHLMHGGLDEEFYISRTLEEKVRQSSGDRASSVASS